jgi:DNA-binding LytR/AlgR family response regulator
MKTEQPLGKEMLQVSQGDNVILLVTDRIAYCYHDGVYNFVRTIDREDYLIDQSLHEVRGYLNMQQFFRVNRKLIVNFAACSDFNVLADGKIEVLLDPAPKEPVMLPQKNAKAFKAWFEACNRDITGS